MVLVYLTSSNCVLSESHIFQAQLSRFNRTFTCKKPGRMAAPNAKITAQVWIADEELEDDADDIEDNFDDVCVFEVRSRDVLH